MWESLLADPAAAAAGLVALVCLTTWPLFSTRSGILLMQLGAGVGFAAHYWLLGHLAPSLVNVLGVVQTIVALLAPRSPTLNRIGYALVPMMAAVGIHFWTGPVSGLAVAAMALIAIGRMQRSQWSLRMLIMAGGVFWSLHDALVGSWIAFSADVASLGIGVGTLAIMVMSDRPAVEGQRIR